MIILGIETATQHVGVALGGQEGVIASFGVALGHLLPEERLATAARWTGRAVRNAWHLGDRQLLDGLQHGHPVRYASGL